MRRSPSKNSTWPSDASARLLGSPSVSDAWRRDGSLQHSDRGIQYAADEYRQALAAAKKTPSMSRKGNCLDNAPMESFLHTLKVERVHHRVYATRDEARRDLFAYIEGFYNSRRLHSAIGNRSPADMERMAA